MAERKPKRAKKQRGLAGRILYGFLVFVLAMGLLGVGSFIYLYTTSKAPDPNAEFQTNTTFIYYAGGEQMSSLAIQNRETLAYENIPEVMKQAAVAAENRSFWTDPGYSISGITRAAWNIVTGGEVQGGSTITQQYIKIMYLDSERTFDRKIRELFLAMKIDKVMSKEDILAGYLNTIYFGRGAYGVQAAAKSFFLKPASELTIPEAAALAAILNNPSGFNPSGDDQSRERLLGRYRYVLDGMLEMEYITAAQHAEYSKQLPTFPEVPKNNRYGGPTGYLVNMVEKEMAKLGFSEAQVQGGGLKITTTIDKRLNDHAIKVVQEAEKKATSSGRDGADPKDLHIALASVDTLSGGILALYGGRDFVTEGINWATTARPAASTFKAFGLVAGVRQGYRLTDVFRGNSFVPKGEAKSINNQGRTQYGNITLRRGTEVSSNTVFVDLTEHMEDGPESVAKAANDAGAPRRDDWDITPNIALGYAQVSPVNMANAYATLANEGMRNEAHIVARVEDRHGKVLFDESQLKSQQTIERDVALITVDALKSVVRSGTGSGARALGYPVAAKTGTNERSKGGIDAGWFLGTTKQVSTSVMFVAGDGTADITPYRQPGTRTFFGSGYPLQTWLAFMKEAMDGKLKEDWPEADGYPARRGKAPMAKPKPSKKSESPEPSEPPSEEPTTEPTEPAPRVPTVEPTPTKPPKKEPLPPTKPPKSEDPTPKPTKPPKKSPKPEPSQEPTGGVGG